MPRKHIFYLPMGPGGDRCWRRLTGVKLLASACVCSLFGVFLFCEESLVLLIGNVSSLFCDSSNSSSSPSADTPEDKGLDVCLCSTPVLLGVTRSGVPLSISPFSSDSLSITSDAISQELPVARSQRRLQQMHRILAEPDLKLPLNFVRLTQSGGVANSYAVCKITALSYKQKRQILHSIQVIPLSKNRKKVRIRKWNKCTSFA